MATIQAFIRYDEKGKRYDKTKPVNVRFRIRDGRIYQIFYVSELEIVPDKWDKKKQQIKAKVLYDEIERSIFNKKVLDRKSLILEILKIYTKKGEELTSEILVAEIDKHLFPEKYKTPQTGFFDIYENFLIANSHQNENWKTKHKAIIRSLKRFEIHKKRTINIDKFKENDVQAFEDFLKIEHELYNQKPEIYNTIHENRPLKPKGHNYISVQLSKFRSFYLWAYERNITNNYPFKKRGGGGGGYKIKPETYGTPYYINIQERNQIYNFDMSLYPNLEIQRDIFVFQCFIGCRVSDLYNMKKNSVNGGFLEYIAGKTKDNKPKTMRIPLRETAQNIYDKYKDVETDKNQIFPFTYKQKYNEDIKTIFELVGITRIVTTIDPLTKNEVKRPINEVAGSHMARRCLIGNLYAKVKDGGMVGSVSGHVSNSKAFERYYNVDDEVKIEIMDKIE